MKSALMVLSLFVVCAQIAYSENDMSKDPEVFRDRFNGAIEPERVPYSGRIAGLAGVVGVDDNHAQESEALVKRARETLGLMEGDANKVVAFLVAEMNLSKPIGKPGESMEDFCAENNLHLPIDQIDLATLGHEMNIMQARGEQMAKDRYEDLLLRLSHSGELDLEGYVNEKILPMTRGVTFDFELLMQELPPEHVERMMNKMCPDKQQKGRK